MTVDVVGTGLLGRAISSAAAGWSDVGEAVVCAAGVADSRCDDPREFKRERDLLRELVERARDRRARLVYFSGAPVYGRQDNLRIESDPVAPESAYGRHKVACEQLVADGGVAFVVLRLPNVIGPSGHPAQLLPSLVRQVAAGEVVVQAAATRDLIDVDDLVAILGSLLRSDHEDAVLNVASGISTPVFRLVAEIAHILEASPRVITVPGGDRQEFSTARIRARLPDYPTFGPDYPTEALRRRVRSLERDVIGDRRRDGGLPAGSSPAP